MWELARLEAEKEAGKDMNVDVDMELGGGCLVKEVLDEEDEEEAEESGSEGGKADGGCGSTAEDEKGNPSSCRVSASGECYESWARQQKPARGSSKGDTRSATPLNWDL